MHISELDYPLPEDLIAGQPIEPRESCRLMVVHRNSSKVEHRNFTSLKDYLKPGDLLVLNTARVTPARLYARGEPPKDRRRFEILVLNPPASRVCTALVNPSRRAHEDLLLLSENTKEKIRLLRNLGEGRWEIALDKKTWIHLLEAEGHLALPPYILKIRKEKCELPKDRDWYQTVYSDREGAIAAPTAGLHFSSPLLEQLENSGVELARIFLKVGMGTFQPIRTEQLEHHKLLPEEFEITQEAADKLNAAIQRKARIIAVGTTVVRTLEFLTRDAKDFHPCRGEADLFIRPPYKFQTISGMLTNFHLPQTTLLALVYAMGGTELVQKAYAEAIRERYRFFSYGDAMLIL